MKDNTIEELIYSMLLTNTGQALGDSGGNPKYDKEGNYIGSDQGHGRNHERNAHKTLNDFKNEPEVTFDDYGLNISVFHYLTKQFELDDLCIEFNNLKCDNWDSNIIGISQEQEDWLIKHDLHETDSFNTYNHDSNLSQVIQGSILKKLDSYDNEGYLLIQIHQGADIRGGYTDAKLVVPEASLSNFEDVFLYPEQVYGKIIRDKDILHVSNDYDGWNLTLDYSELNEEIIENKNPKLFKDSELGELIYKSKYENNEIIEYKETDTTSLWLGIN